MLLCTVSWYVRENIRRPWFGTRAARASRRRCGRPEICVIKRSRGLEETTVLVACAYKHASPVLEPLFVETNARFLAEERAGRRWF